MSQTAHHYLPPRPRLGFRVGFAGSQELSPQEDEILDRALKTILTTIGVSLAEIVKGHPGPPQHLKHAAGFYDAHRTPILRLVTGLCEGADALAGKVLRDLRFPAGTSLSETLFPSQVETELAAILPCDPAAYRRLRPIDFRAEFDRQLADCAWVVALDGICEKPNPDQFRAKALRSRAYRAQVAFLLRQSDLVIAASNPNAEGKPGGTLETVRAALAFELPVIFVNLGTGNVHLIEPPDDLTSVLAAEAPLELKDLQAPLAEWIRQLVAMPEDSVPSPKAHGHGKSQTRESRLEEYFGNSNSTA